MQINILEELEPYMDRFEKANIIDNKLICCSPFRPDRRPSFVVFLDKGNWVDSGNTFKKAGTFPQLLAHLSGDMMEDILQYLHIKNSDLTDMDTVKLDLNLDLSLKGVPLTSDSLQRYLFRHPYLGNRGISEKVQRAFKVGYDNSSQAVVIPWMDSEGNVVKLKFRSVKQKKFWYSKKGDRIKEHLFGLYFVKKHGFKSVWIVEGEIDCMYLWSCGIPAVATGTASISRTQVKFLKQSGVEELVIASDNDEAGFEFRGQLVKTFSGIMTVKDFEFPSGVKDVNDLTVEQIRNLKKRLVELSFL